MFEWTDPASGKQYSYNWDKSDDVGKTNKSETLELLEQTVSKHIDSLKKRKEYDKMFMNNKVKVLINGKAYMPSNVLSHMRPGSVRTYDIDVTADERYEISLDTTPKIKDVIFNPPATIVLWEDNTKTVVKAQNDEVFDPEKGLTMAFFKKMHENKGHYFEEIKKWTKEFEKKREEAKKEEIKLITAMIAPDKSEPEVESKKPEAGWVIFYLKKNRVADEGYTRYPTVYRHKSSAVRQAKKLVTAEKCLVDRYDPDKWTDD